MYRKIIENLIEWKKSSDKKPLIIKGARQVGKSFIMQEFGEKYYTSYVYINFDEDENVRIIFDSDKNPERIINDLSIYTKIKIEKEKTLIIFDEIQFCEKALNSLKYFYEKSKGYDVICAGSLLGTYLKNQGMSYPVGCVNILEMHPMTFDEFLMAMDSKIYTYKKECDYKNGKEIIFHNQLNELYKKYLMIGGMPECVNEYIKNKDINRVRKIQNDLIFLYENDISKYNGKVDAGKMLAIFRNISTQLAKVNRKFIYKYLKNDAKSRDYQSSIEWLKSASLVLQVNNISNIESPLRAYVKENEFKLYMFDVGILNALAGVNNADILLDGNYSFKGAITENYVIQELMAKDINAFYYCNKEQEIDFIYEDNFNIIPIEVKSTKNLNSTSFKNMIKRYNVKSGIRYSMMQPKINDNFIDMPLYLV